MRPAKTGTDHRTRAALSWVIMSLILLVGFPDDSHGIDANFTSQTYFHYFERDLLGEKATFAPLYEYLSANAYNLGGRPLAFHFYGWGRHDFGDGLLDDKRTGDITNAYLEYLHPTGNAQARLGRFFFSEGVASEILDGLFLKARTPAGAGVALFGGVPAERSIIAADEGDFLLGGRLFFIQKGFVEIGASYLFESGDFLGDDRKVAGLDLWLRPAGFVELVGRTAYNISTSDIATQRYMVRIHPTSRIDVAGGYEQYRYRDLFQWALNSAFLTAKTFAEDEVRVFFAVIDWRFWKGLTLEASVRAITHDRDDPGDADRGEIGLRYTFNDRRDTAGLSAALVRADRDENEYQEYRVFATYSPGRMRFALDALTQRFEEGFPDPAGDRNTYQVVGSANYEVLPHFRVGGDLRYLQSPRFREDLALFARATIVFSLATEGGK
jgi:hypothetical protein